MELEELNEIDEEEWQKFCRRYPIVTSEKFVCRLLSLFKKKTMREVWLNGFLRGWVICHERTNAKSND